MENDHIEKLFGELKGTFDLEDPLDGHRQRFLEKLEASATGAAKTTKIGWRWKPLSIAAALFIVCSIGFYYSNPSPSIQEQVSKISPEISNSEYYFASVIEEQVKKMQGESTPETQQLIADTMTQLKTLDSDYKKMVQDLLDGGNSKLILSAMITNFQTRIDLLNEVLEQIEEIKNFKNYDNEHITA
jgi:uncharacterized protein YsxB (DUF464 family)